MSFIYELDTAPGATNLHNISILSDDVNFPLETSFLAKESDINFDGKIFIDGVEHSVHGVYIVYKNLEKPYHITVYENGAMLADFDLDFYGKSEINSNGDRVRHGIMTNLSILTPQ